MTNSLRNILFILFLFPSLTLALESSLPDEASCSEWKSHVMSWFQQEHVKLVGNDKEVIITCSKDEKARDWTGRIASRLTKQKAQALSSSGKNLNCVTSGTRALQRGVASEKSDLLDTPCKIAGNDIKLFKQEIVSPPKTKVSDGGYVCCGHIANRWVSCTAGRMFDNSCKLSCVPCVGIQQGPAWGF